MPIDFTAIDFETANSAAASPCAVGLVKVRDGKIVDEWGIAFLPPLGHQFFHPGNIAIHGIRPSDVSDGPEWHEVLPLLLDFVGDDILVAHNAPFDMGVLRAAAYEVGAELPALNYLCTVQLSRKAFPGLDSHRLPSVAMRVGFDEFKHHDALDDSRACAHILMYVAKMQGTDDLDEVLKATGQTLKPLLK
jgi:DNA polymerase-3 subunit epsilon